MACSSVPGGSSISGLETRKKLRVLPHHALLRVQAVHSMDVGEAYRLAVMREVRGAFNIAAGPVLAIALREGYISVPQPQ